MPLLFGTNFPCQSISLFLKASTLFLVKKFENNYLNCLTYIEHKKVKHLCLLRKNETLGCKLQSDLKVVFKASLNTLFIDPISTKICIVLATMVYIIIS